MAKNEDDTYSEEETQRRVEAALKAAFKMPRKRDAEMRLGKGAPNRSPKKVGNSE
jgi:hypothetical protein